MLQILEWHLRCKIMLCQQSDSISNLMKSSKLRVGCVNEGNVRQTGGYLNSQEHVLRHCTKNEELRKGKDLESLEDCVTIFRQVISRRSKKHS